MNVITIVKRLGIKEPKVAERATELLRKADTKGSLRGQAQVCGPAICVEIATSMLKVQVDRSQIMRFSGVTEKEYTNMLRFLRNSLGIKAVVDIRAMAVQFGCARIVDTIARVLKTYKEATIAGLPSERQIHADLSAPVYAAVAVYLTAKKHKAKIDRPKVLVAAAVTEEEFKTVCESMYEACFHIIGIGQRQKRAREDESDESADEAEGCGDKDDAYAAWKARVTAKESVKEVDVGVDNSNRKENTPNSRVVLPTKATKQAKLNFGRIAAPR
uniref:Origin recognition complex subunit 6 n=1 Tax=Pyramimonas obovata TaxID=1411642 RepID=A0A7S0RNG9_9CHLO|mmetsp:Transcript_38802/g.84451  ORF Transcript_38802/g.84451 Transcript_38802/m.84451 type:complete len:273 (+) Transcript_38802:194-1012(+)|eukprot:CAMPEP_0118945490 /NCGR_PEP_ID=MMETSP1169-20130426/42375_1 /TAXON_ID=36882 /ORGANISM="Pyramimonas obovata, Strain CCMP722" /LENGTH=272 /DNA_ID=CAMNT_0006891219 /DNA_START=128 /DNA_END=946 /DNA_ORIENTATION=-